MKISKETRALAIIITGIAVLGNASYIWHSLRRTLNPDGFNRLVCVEYDISELSVEEAANRIGLFYEKPEKEEGSNAVKLRKFCNYYGPYGR